MHLIRLSKHSSTWFLCFVCRNHWKQKRDSALTTLRLLAYNNFCFRGHQLSAGSKACNFPASARKHNASDLLQVFLHRLLGVRDGGIAHAHKHTHSSQHAGNLIDPVVRRSPLLLLCGEARREGAGSRREKGELTVLSMHSQRDRERVG